MDKTMLDLVGIAGGSFSVLAVALWIVKKVCHSRCIRKDDGNIAVELSLNIEEIQTIQSSEELRRQLADLKNQIQSRKNITV